MILFLDDNPSRMENAVEELRMRNFQVHFEQNVDSALAFIDKHSSEIDALICDIMMPHGTRLSSEQTRDGLRTGISVLEIARSLQPTLPTIIFSNVSDDELRKTLKGDERCLFLEKPNYLSASFADKVRDFLGSL